MYSPLNRTLHALGVPGELSDGNYEKYWDGDCDSLAFALTHRLSPDTLVRLSFDGKPLRVQVRREYLVAWRMLDEAGYDTRGAGYRKVFEQADPESRFEFELYREQQDIKEQEFQCRLGNRRFPERVERIRAMGMFGSSPSSDHDCEALARLSDETRARLLLDGKPLSLARAHPPPGLDDGLICENHDTGRSHPAYVDVEEQTITVFNPRPEGVTWI